MSKRGIALVASPAEGEGSRKRRKEHTGSDAEGSSEGPKATGGLSVKEQGLALWQVVHDHTDKGQV